MPKPTLLPAGALVLAVVAATATGCDPAGSVVVNNQSAAEYIARIQPFGDGRATDYAIPPGARLQVATNAVGNLPAAKGVALLDDACQERFGQNLTDIEFPGGGEVTIHADGAIDFTPGNPVIPDTARRTTRCGL